MQGSNGSNLLPAMSVQYSKQLINGIGLVNRSWVKFNIAAKI